MFAPNHTPVYARGMLPTKMGRRVPRRIMLRHMVSWERRRMRRRSCALRGHSRCRFRYTTSAYNVAQMLKPFSVCLATACAANF